MPEAIPGFQIGRPYLSSTSLSNFRAVSESMNPAPTPATRYAGSTECSSSTRSVEPMVFVAESDPPVFVAAPIAVVPKCRGGDDPGWLGGAGADRKLRVQNSAETHPELRREVVIEIKRAVLEQFDRDLDESRRIFPSVERDRAERDVRRRHLAYSRQSVRRRSLCRYRSAMGAAVRTRCP